MLLTPTIRFILLISIIIPVQNSYSQNCSPDVYSFSYEGNAAFNINQTSLTPQNDVISVGQVLQINGGLGYDAFIAKLSGRGNILWAKRYMLPGYNTGGFNCVAMASDSSYLVCGRFGFLKKRYIDGVIEELYAVTVMVHLDQYGNWIWTKVLNRFVTYFTNITKILKIDNGDFILTASISSLNYSRTLVCRMEKNGDLKWSKLLSSDYNLFSIASIRQRNNGNIILAGTVYKNDYTESAYQMLCIDDQTGDKIFNRAYFVINTTNSFFNPLDRIEQISEWPNGEMSLFTSLSDSGRQISAPYSQKAAVITTDANGKLLRAAGYYNEHPGCRLSDASDPDSSGNQLLLLDDGVKGFVVKTNQSGDLVAGRGLGGMDPLTSPLKFLPGNRIVFAGRGQVAQMGLIKTEADGQIACIETPAHIIRQDISQAIVEKDIQVQIENFDNYIFSRAGGGIGRVNYSLNARVICYISCCTNTVHHQSKIELCNVPSYTLPNNHLVKESGIYDVNYKTTQGCDSIVFYDINFLKKPQISLGDDICMNGKDSVVLKVAGGYTSYAWLNNFSGDSSYTVTLPGKYWVLVGNSCGTATDSIEIFDRCDFPVYIPSGFTPNNDGLNDIFRVSPQTKNKFISLQIFNRSGELVFESNNIDKGWDGKLKGQLQPTGVYLYVIRMKDLAGKEMIAKGSFALIR
jgi:gliding motility-associated-like protein